MTQPEQGARADDPAALHQAYADELASGGYLRGVGVETAFRAVPRHLFLPSVPLQTAYSNVHVPTAERDGTVISSSSQPSLMAYMLELLDLRPGQRALEIGAGTGYNAALLASIAGEAGTVVTLDVDEQVATDARAHLVAAGYERVQVVCADGAAGYALAAPYDGIIVTTAAPDIAPAWHEQLAPGGRLVLPLKLTLLMGRELLMAFARVGDHLESVAVTYCGFLPMRGEMSEMPADEVQLGTVNQRDLNFAAQRLHVFAYAHDAGYVPAEGETVVDKPATRLVLMG